MKSVTGSSINRYTLILVIGWSLVIAGLTYRAIAQNKETTRELAISQARAHFKKDTAMRLWATQHGRIYVPIGDYYQPDPLLAHIPDRDVSTPGGIGLSLINPARIIRQLDEDYGELYGVSGRIVSRAPLYPGNAPDEWESKGLATFDAGKKEVFGFTDIDGEPFLRLMQPLTMEKGCLLCHSHQGLSEGDVSGAIGIKLPMRVLLEREHAEISKQSLTFLVLWLFGLAGIAVGYLQIARQHQDRKKAVEALLVSERRKSAVMEAALDCIITIDASGRIVEFNPAAEETFGYLKEDIIGLDMAELIIPPSFRDQHHNGLKKQLAGGGSSIMDTRIETTAMRSDSTEFPVELTITRIELESETLFTAYLRDITVNRYMSEQLAFQASHDALTGLINRPTFEKKLRERIESLGESSFYCLLYLDLDQFRVLNNTGGHAAGDELLRQLAILFQENIEAHDILARLGGDEFGILLEDCTTMKKGKQAAAKLLDAVRDYRFYWQHKPYNLGVSIGLIPIRGADKSVTEILSLGDSACVKAKEEGRNRVYLYQKDDEDFARRRSEMSWVNQLREAILEDNFTLMKQPIQRLHNDDGVADGHFEILLRMNGKEEKLITPDQFIPTAERYNLMPSLDRWVIRNTFLWLSRIEQLESSVKLCAINLSGLSITDPEFTSFIQEQLKQHSIPAGIICFEITETAAIGNLSRASSFISALHETGCLFALDDFGSGMSSYGYLKNLPVNFLKIDGEFVRDMVNDDISRAMVRSIHEIGHLMGKQTIAEYVENQEIIEQLREIGVDFCQGYAIGKPAPLP